MNRINQDADISRQISLWDQHGSQAEFGTLLVIPIEESLIYVRPLYLRSEGGKIPELKRVIVVYEKQIAMKPTLREAIDAIFAMPRSTAAPAAAAQAEPEKAVRAPHAPGDAATLAGEALDHFERAIEAQRAGDWARYGQELQAVERLLRDMAPRRPDAGTLQRTARTITRPARSAGRPGTRRDARAPRPRAPARRSCPRRAGPRPRISRRAAAPR